ncbi:hypothetical protein TYRP_011427 [Tyrophagus putrescentiae]|nr:hypothetical protein TYRP_011427 [Tyrophagus putrescentiae]
MFSVNQLLALNQSTSVVHSLVDAFFEAKKVILKARLRDSMETVVEGVFAELEQQFQQSLLKEEEQDDDVVDGGDKAVVAVDERVQNDQLVPYIAPAEIAATVATVPAAYVESISNEAIPSSKNPDQQSSKEAIISNTLVLAVKSKPGPSSAVQVKRPLKEEDDEDDEDKEIPVSNASRKKIKQEVKDEKEDEEEDEKEVVDGESIATSVTTRSKKDSKQSKISSSSSSKKSYACTFSPDSCAYESPIKFSVVRHILNVHLKKSAAGIKENEDKDPSKYLAIKEA